VELPLDRSTTGACAYEVDTAAIKAAVTAILLIRKDEYMLSD
jgi:hypothetical protein